MLEWDKNLIAKTFSIAGDKNTKYTILVTTDTYDICINNPDVKLVIEWDIPMIFNSMIQQMGRAGKKIRVFVFILFTSK